MSSESYLDDLNSQQRDAVEYDGGPALVIAGAGSGKTRVLTYKIVHLLRHGTDPHRIMALTFTNKAAREMKERIATLIGEGEAARLWMGTFHSIFLRLLRYNCDRIGFRHDFTIYDAADSRSLIKTIIKDMQLDDKVYKPNTLQSQISNLKNSLISPTRYAADAAAIKADTQAKRPLFHTVYSAYWNRCRVANAMDFDDILFYTNVLFRDNGDVLQRYQEFFQYLLVDEYQDTNFAQHLIVSQLCAKHRRMFVVGDDAQSIYSFRGANIKNILTLSERFPDLRIFKLEQNYRSTQNILDAANSLIEKNKQQIPKHIFSDNNRGSKVSVIQAYSGYEESYVVANKIIELRMRQGDSYQDFAVLYRTNAQSRVLEEALRKRNIPYRIWGGLSFYQRKEVKDVISYFRLAVNPDDDEALRRIINYPARGIGDTSVGKLTKAAGDHNCSIWNVLCTTTILDTAGFNRGTIAKLNTFTSLVQSFVAENINGKNAYEVAQKIINDTHVYSILLTDNTPENISKQENIQELLSGVGEFVSTRTEEEGTAAIGLSNFLSEVSLATDQDSDTESTDGSRVTLMTVHAAKGLEYKNIIIVGAEEELFPAALSSDSPEGIEEERRLMYVAITRAKFNCIITYANTRYINGQTKMCNPSRFLRDIDPSLLTMTQTSASHNGDDFGVQRQPMAFKPASQPRFKPSASRNADYGHSTSTIRAIYNRPTATPASTPEAATAQGGFTPHSVDEIAVGSLIVHSRFGDGVITHIDRSGADTKITVNFTNLGSKVLLMKFAKFRITKK